MATGVHPEPEGTRAAPASPRPLAVLVVDDEAAIRLALSAVLERRGHRVVCAETCDDGYARACEGPFDAALVDLRLPGNGITLLERLEALPALAGRTVLMTGSVDPLADGAAAPWPQCLPKPFDYDEMVALVERLGG